MKTVEFKIRNDQSWEKSSILLVKDFPEKTADAMAKSQAQKLANKNGEQVRWNFSGLLQGHYVDPDPKVMRVKTLRSELKELRREIKPYLGSHTAFLGGSFLVRASSLADEIAAKEKELASLTQHKAD